MRLGALRADSGRRPRKQGSPRIWRRGYHLHPDLWLHLVRSPSSCFLHLQSHTPAKALGKGGGAERRCAGQPSLSHTRPFCVGAENPVWGGLRERSGVECVPEIDPLEPSSCGCSPTPGHPSAGPKQKHIPLPTPQCPFAPQKPTEMLLFSLLLTTTFLSSLLPASSFSPVLAYRSLSSPMGSLLPLPPPFLCPFVCPSSRVPTERCSLAGTMACRAGSEADLLCP